LLPPNSVRLQPVRISQRIAQKNALGAIAWGETAPATLVEVPTESYPPAVLYVDIFAHVHPYWRVPYEAYNWGTTFGKTVLPLITVRTSPRAAPKTLGGIAGMNAFVPYLRIPPVTADAADALGVTFVEYLNSTAGVPPTLREFSKDQVSDRPPVSLDSLSDILALRKADLVGITDTGEKYPWSLDYVSTFRCTSFFGERDCKTNYA